MAHQFDMSKIDRLNSEERKKLLAPFETLKKLGYAKGDVMADIGCGSGLFTLTAAEINEGETQTYAVDVSEEMLREVERRIEKAGYRFIQTVKSEEYDFKLGDGSADFVLICTVLHEIEDKDRFLKEAARVCRAGGKIAVIEFGEEETGFGPPRSLRLSANEVTELLATAGFHFISEIDVNEGIYTVVAKKD
jgi:Methylase involved in ubiquinone/menaquinone biosynthesis